jgi:hypothetical protein
VLNSLLTLTLAEAQLAPTTTMVTSRSTEPTSTLSVEWATSTRQHNLAAISAIEGSPVLGRASTRKHLSDRPAYSVR